MFFKTHHAGLLCDDMKEAGSTEQFNWNQVDDSVFDELTDKELMHDMEVKLHAMVEEVTIGE